MSDLKAGRLPLVGAESALFRVGLYRLVKELDRAEVDGLPLNVGVQAFDHLRYAEKLAVLEQVGCTVLHSVNQPFVHTAFFDGCLAAVYAHLKAQLAVELDVGRSTAMRRLIRAACAEVGIAEVPPPRGVHRDCEWDAAVSLLMDRVLPERHWEREWPCPDAHPLAAQALRRELGILDDDYFVAVPPDPSSEQMRRIRVTLRRLVTPPSRSKLVSAWVAPKA